MCSDTILFISVIGAEFMQANHNLTLIVSIRHIAIINCYTEIRTDVTAQKNRLSKTFLHDGISDSFELFDLSLLW